MSAILKAVRDQLVDEIESLKTRVPGAIIRREDGESKRDFMNRLPDEMLRQPKAEWRDAEGQDSFPPQDVEPSDSTVSVKWYPELSGLRRLAARIRVYIEAEERKR